MQLPFDPRGLIPAEQRAEITEHLATHIAPDALDSAVMGAAIALIIARVNLDGSSKDRTEIYSGICHHAERLRALMAELGELERGQIWEGIGVEGGTQAVFDKLLELIVARFPAPPAQTNNVGRPRKAWRDRMIAMVYAAYPPGTAKKTIGSDFEKTIGLLLRIVGEDSDASEVHSAVLKALQRESGSIITVKAVRQPANAQEGYTVTVTSTPEA